ncbi:pilus assembly protein CpaF [Mariprofundus ferrinatatus]|uniref:Pilus assembly protein CpaF n=1 Tax=Mariprofundus ferrinatatus TaxID=1921087 RepID=A0A2K8L358_9PROT|nr:CpaF family protein [Mariprofundus ferrinatatus]ATX81770.1 pilus assembly protein CpaF [Mariprofundus ferrinatatus]
MTITSDSPRPNWDEAHASEAGKSTDQSKFQAFKQRVHRRLLERMNLKIIDQVDEATVRKQISQEVRDIISEEPTPLNAKERARLESEIQDEVLGLGPLESLLADQSVNDILVNTFNQIYVERHGVLERTDIRFQNNEHLQRIIDKIASSVGRRVDESSPMVDARLADGSRVNAVIPPAALDGPILSIRKFSTDPFQISDLVEFKAMTPRMATFLAAAVKARINILISGGTGSGKTTLLNALSGFVPEKERIVTIEDSAELQLQQPHVVRLEVRPPNIEGKGEITQRDLVRNCLRMRPDRIVVGEVRGAESLDMLQAMNTGHDGSLTTIHANSPRDALTRLEHMVGMSGVPIPTNVVRQQIAAAINLLISSERMLDGRRVITSIQEITGMEGDIVNMQEIFTFKRKTVDESGHVVGEFRATGIRPRMINRFTERGISLNDDLFDPKYVYE